MDRTDQGLAPMQQPAPVRQAERQSGMRAEIGKGRDGIAAPDQNDRTAFPVRSPGTGIGQVPDPGKHGSGRRTGPHQPASAGGLTSQRQGAISTRSNRPARA